MKIVETYYGLDDFLASQAGGGGATEELVRRVVEYVEEKKLDPDTIEISLGEEVDVQVAIPAENQSATFSLGLNWFSEAPLDQIKKEEELATFITLAQDNVELHEALERVIRLGLQGAPENFLREALRDLEKQLSEVEAKGDENSEVLCQQIRSLRDDPNYPKMSGLTDRHGKIISEEGSQSDVNTGLALDLWNMGFLNRPDLEKLGFQEIIDSHGSRMEFPINRVKLEGPLVEALVRFKEYLHSHQLDVDHLGYALDTQTHSLTMGTQKLIDHYRASFKSGLLDPKERQEIVGTFAASLPVGILESGLGVARYLFKDLPIYAWRKIFWDKEDLLDRQRLAHAEGKVTSPYKMGRAIYEAGALEFVKGVGDDFSRRWESGGLKDQSEILGMVTSMALPLGYLGAAKGVAVVGKAKHLLPLLKTQKILSVRTGMKVAKTLVKTGVRAVIEFSPLGDFQVLILLTKRFGAVVLEVPMTLVREGRAAVSDFVNNILSQLPSLELATPEGVRLPLAMAMSDVNGGKSNGNGNGNGKLVNAKAGETWDAPTQKLPAAEVKADADTDIVPVMPRKLPQPIDWEIPLLEDGSFTRHLTWSGATLGWFEAKGITIPLFAPDASTWREVRQTLDEFLLDALIDPVKTGFSGIVDPAFLRLYREVKNHFAVMQEMPNQIHMESDPVFAQRVAFFEEYLQPLEVLPPEISATLPKDWDNWIIFSPVGVDEAHTLINLDSILAGPDGVLSRYQEIPKDVRRGVTNLIGKINKRLQPIEAKASLEHSRLSLAQKGYPVTIDRIVPTPEPNSKMIAKERPGLRRTITPPPAPQKLKDVKFSKETTGFLARMGVDMERRIHGLDLDESWRAVLSEPGNFGFENIFDPKIDKIRGEIGMVEAVVRGNKAIKMSIEIPDVYFFFFYAPRFRNLPPPILAKLPSTLRGWIPEGLSGRALQRHVADILDRTFQGEVLSPHNQKVLEKVRKMLGVAAPPKLTSPPAAADSDVARVIKLVARTPTPPPRPGELTMAMARAGMDTGAQRAVREAIENRVIRGTRRARNGAIGVGVAAVGAVGYSLTRKNGSGTLKIDEASLANLTLSEKTLKGLQATIGNLEKQLEGIAPTPATPAEKEGVRAESLAQEMYEAKIYSAFTQLREKGMAEKRAVTLEDLEKLLNENGVTDLGVRLRFYQLALKYFERVAQIEKKSKQLQEVIKDGKIDSKSVKCFIEEEFGFTPQGKIEFVVRDIHIATIFHDDEDYIKATSPHDSLWEKDPKDYDAEEKAIYKGLRNHALETGGMSFGEGLTIQRSFGEEENGKTLEHEEGHELVSIGPFFTPRKNPWKMWETSGDIDALLESVFWQEGVRSLHNEMISYFREPGAFRKSNPFYKGSQLYDPKVTRNLREVLWKRVRMDSDRFQKAKVKLDEVHRQFFEQVDQTYEKLKQLALLFEAKPELADKYKPRIVAWLSIRGDRPWDADLLKYIEYDQEIQGKPKPQKPAPKKPEPKPEPEPTPKKPAPEEPPSGDEIPILNIPLF